MNIGFIGCGNMGRAMISGMLGRNAVQPGQLMVADASQDAAASIAAAWGLRTGADNKEVADWSDILFLAVKPNVLQSVILDIAEAVDAHTVVVTLAPGKTLAWIQDCFARPVRLIRTMPNTPALAGEGMTALCPNDLTEEADLQTVVTLLQSFSRTAVIPETLMDVATGVSGSSPAYVFMFIEALADAAVLEGMARAQAYEFAAQTVYGSAKLMLETGKHPGELKDMVCSPGGTTIEAVRVLEEKGFRSAVIDATKACIEKSRAL